MNATNDQRAIEPEYIGGVRLHIDSKITPKTPQEEWSARLSPTRASSGGVCKRRRTIRPFVLAVVATLKRRPKRICSVCFDEVAQGHGATCAGDDEHLCCVVCLAQMGVDAAERPMAQLTDHELRQGRYAVRCPCSAMGCGGFFTPAALDSALRAAAEQPEDNEEAKEEAAAMYGALVSLARAQHALDVLKPMHEPNECPDVLAARAAAKVAAEAAVRAAQMQAAQAAEEERMGRVVVVHGCAEGLGLGLDDANRVTWLKPGGAAWNQGEIGYADRVISVDGRPLEGAKLSDVLIAGHTHALGVAKAKGGAARAALRKVLERKEMALMAHAEAVARRRDDDLTVAAQQEGIRAQFRRHDGSYACYMCPKCHFGPVDHGACSSLSSHHGETRAGGRARVNNACPKCGWFGSDIQQWPAWDGKRVGFLCERDFKQPKQALVRGSKPARPKPADRPRPVREERVPRPQPLPANVVEHMSFEEQVQAAMDASIQLELHRRQQRDWRRRMPVIDPQTAGHLMYSWTKVWSL